MLKKVLLATSTAVAALGSSAVLADPPYWAPAYGWHGHHHHHHGYYMPAAPVYVAPRPVYVVPAPQPYYAPAPAPVVVPAPVYPAPVYGHPGVSIRFNLPL